MATILVILLSIASAILYRMGGSGKFNTLYRDLGCPATNILALLAMGITAPVWAWVVTYGIMFGSMTTYCKIGNQEDVKWYNWLLTGLMYGVTPILLLIFGSITIVPFIIRTIVLGLSVMVSSEFLGWDVAEESTRGFLFTITNLFFR